MDLNERTDTTDNPADTPADTPMRTAVVTVELDKRRSEIVMDALLPETGRDIPRTRAEIERTDRGVRLTISADDTSPLRAGLNSYLRWLNVSLAIAERVQ